MNVSDFLNSANGQRLLLKLKNGLNRYQLEYPTIEKFLPKLGIDNFEVQSVAGQKTVVSVSGEQCLWDLATMSMRGPVSCMKWDSHHSSHLLGSLLDPGVGIIYTTDDTQTAYGRTIIIRSLIRLVLAPTDLASGKIASASRERMSLFLERPYVKRLNHNGPNDNCATWEQTGIIFSEFKDALQTKTDLPIVSNRSPNQHNFNLPTFAYNKELTATYKSLRDSGLQYSSYNLYDNFGE